jgi:RHS repeat-associated protein
MDQASTSTPAAQSPTVGVHYSDTKGNLTHTFKASGRDLRSKFRYDDYGLLLTSGDQGKPSEDNHHSTYEGKFLDEKPDLLDFGARWYDPLVGRFATPDTMTDPALLLAPDGMNRHAFENNDPINQVDPSGHWSRNATWAC